MMMLMMMMMMMMMMMTDLEVQKSLALATGGFVWVERELKGARILMGVLPQRRCTYSAVCLLPVLWLALKPYCVEFP